jgi:hypothetical protein
MVPRPLSSPTEASFSPPAALEFARETHLDPYFSAWVFIASSKTYSADFLQCLS